MNPWELHPMLVHFPIAFLLGGVLLDIIGVCRRDSSLTRGAAWLIVAGVASGWIAAAAGVLALLTVPAHTEQAHALMYWHLLAGLLALVLFTVVAIVRLRAKSTAKQRFSVTIGVVAAVLVIATGALGSTLVYHGGAGVSPELLSREIREGHSHTHGHDDKPNPKVAPSSSHDHHHETAAVNRAPSHTEQVGPNGDPGHHQAYCDSW